MLHGHLEFYLLFILVFTCVYVCRHVCPCVEANAKLVVLSSGKLPTSCKIGSVVDPKLTSAGTTVHTIIPDVGAGNQIQNFPFTKPALLPAEPLPTPDNQDYSNLPLHCVSRTIAQGKST